MYKKHLFLCFIIISSISLSAQCWNLVWEDNFDGNSLDLTKWTPQSGAGGWGNNELQYYTDRADNIQVSNGTLKIIAKEENYMGSNYTSARLRTINQGDWIYGRFEARLKTPIGKGLWPAFWMLSTDSPYGAWPQGGEIDIMELVGHEANISYGSFHYGTPGNLQTQSTGYTLPSGTFHDNFHTFTLEWEATELRYYIDGTLYFTGTKASVAPYNWPFDQEFHFLLNVAVGGSWPGAPDATTTFPQIMEVDYVRVYQMLSDIPVTGKDLVLPYTTNSTYSVPNIPGATYTWSVPTGAGITSGQNTHQITVDWGNQSGNVFCEITSTCGTSTSSKYVTVSINMLSNSDFEQDFTNWRTRLDNGANANFNIVTTNVHGGQKSACIDVSQTGINNWDIQLIHQGLAYENATDYTLSFWAKADQNNRSMTVAFINPNTYSLYNARAFTLTDTWQQYTYAFTAPCAGDVQMNIDLGQYTGSYCLDDFLFTKSSLLPVSLLGFKGTVTDKNTIQLSWQTHFEAGNSYFEIQRLSGAKWQDIGKIEGLNNSTQIHHYRFVDRYPSWGNNRYRLRQIDEDGTAHYSNVISVFLPEKSIRIFPNPATAEIHINGINERESVSFEIFDIQGREITKGAIKQNTIPVRSIPNGIFVLKLMIGNRAEHFLVLKR